MLIVKFAIEEQDEFSDTEKVELNKILKWTANKIQNFVDSPQLVHDFSSLQQFVKSK